MPEEIKKECEDLYDTIKKSQDRLDEIRKICKHENTFKGLWSWRIGAENNATICSDCGTCLEFLDKQLHFQNH